MTVSSVGNPLMHQGLYRDDESGSYQNRYRQYGSGVGRWMQVDPLGYVESLNLHEYVESEPVASLDSAGLMVDDGKGNATEQDCDLQIQRIRNDKDNYTGAVNAGSGGIIEVGSAGGEIICVIGSILIPIPGPEDIIFAEIVTRHGFRVACKAAGKVAGGIKKATCRIFHSKTGREITEGQLDDLLREYATKNPKGPFKPKPEVDVPKKPVVEKPTGGAEHTKDAPIHQRQAPKGASSQATGPAGKRSAELHRDPANGSRARDRKRDTMRRQKSLPAVGVSRRIEAAIRSGRYGSC
ncbi:MAG: RHS repeat-associated core domain-containing protein [Phycisphaerae bacterium]